MRLLLPRLLVTPAGSGAPGAIVGMQQHQDEKGTLIAKVITPGQCQGRQALP